jgi:hypothetical protein
LDYILYLGILTSIGFVLCFYVKENTYTFDRIIDYDDDNNDKDNDKDNDNKKDSSNEEKKDEEATLN